MWMLVKKEIAIERIKQRIPFTVVQESLICLIDLGLTEMYIDEYNRILYKASLMANRISKRRKDYMIKNWHNKSQRTMKDYKSL